MGPLPANEVGNYFMVAVEYFGRWPVEVVIPDKRAETAVEAFATRYVHAQQDPRTSHHGPGHGGRGHLVPVIISALGDHQAGMVERRGSAGDPKPVPQGCPRQP
ncbi:unnamed protein product [Lampetra planeri]